MKLLGNLLWIIFGGLPLALGWFLAGILWTITIIGIPIASQCFKFARLAFAPFGKRVEYSDSGMMFLLNVLWLIFSGIPLFIGHMVWGLIFCVTIIGIPFGKQCFKLAQLALFPFGAQIRS